MKPKIKLNRKESENFVRALASKPRKPTPRMLRAMKAYRATVKSDLD